MMDSQDDFHDELHDTELWLQRILREKDAAESDRAKLLARIAISQTWLRKTIREEVPPGLLARVRANVVVEAAETIRLAGRTETKFIRTNGRAVYRWALGVLGAAAAMIFVVRTLQILRYRADSNALLDSMVSHDDDGWGDAFALIEEDFDDLYNGVESFRTGDDLFDEALEDLNELLSAAEEEDWS